MSNQTFLEFIGAKDRVPNGYWKDIENCKIFMKWLGRKLGYKTTEDWYKVSAKNFKHNGANSILREYGSHINLIKSIFPEYDWLEWKFTYVSKGFWKDVENCKIYMNWLGRKLGYKTLEDWYKVSGKNFTDNGGGGLLNNYHNASHINLIKSVFPDYEWLEWKFVCAPNRFWKDIKNQKKYLLWLVNKLGYKTQEDIYKLTTIDFIDNYGRGLICEICSFQNLIKSVFSEYDWLEWKFNVTPKGFWEDKKNQKKYLLWLGEQLGYKILEDWYKVYGKNFRDNYGGGLVTHNYGGSHINLIKSVFPDYEWFEWKFIHVPNNFWEDKKNQKKYIIWLGKELGYTTMEEWYNIGAIHFHINNGGGLLDKFYKKFN